MLYKILFLIMSLEPGVVHHFFLIYLLEELVEKKMTEKNSKATLSHRLA